MARTIAITNQKGGVGKTTTSINLSAYLARMGQKVLLVDLDPQGNTTGGLGVDRNKVMYTLYDVLIENTPIEEVILKSRINNLSIIPSNAVLAASEVELVKTEEREHRLKNALEKIKDSYDIILIDCPPSLGLLTVNGLTAADFCIIPVQTEYYALEGLGHLVHTIKLVKNRLNPALEVLGIVATMYDKRTILSKQVVDELNKHFGNRVFKSVIPRNIRLAEAPSHGKTILEYDRFSQGAWSYKNLAKELLERAG